jgi:hypothetical protein
MEIYAQNIRLPGREYMLENRKYINPIYMLKIQNILCKGLAPTRQHRRHDRHHYVMAPALPANNWFSPAQTSNFIVSPSELNPTQNGRYMGCTCCKLLPLTREGWN